jgi:hypothetical protein
MPSTDPNVNNPTPDIAKHPTIKDGGAAGFLLWLKSDPVMAKVYARAKPQIDKLIAQKNAGFAGLGDLTDFMQPVQVDPSLFPTPDVSVSTTVPDSSGSSWTSTLSSLISAAGQAVLTGQQLVTANKVTNLQLTRAQSGLPPLNLSAYGVSTTPGLNLGLSSSTEKTVLYLGGGLLAVMLIGGLLKRR